MEQNRSERGNFTFEGIVILAAIAGLAYVAYLCIFGGVGLTEAWYSFLCWLGAGWACM